MNRVSGFVKAHRVLVAIVVAVLVVAGIVSFKGEDIAAAAAPYANKYLGLNLATGSEGETAPASVKPSITIDAGTVAVKSEADQAAILAGLAKTTPDQAKASAVAANTGTTATSAKLQVVNGGLVYAVGLSNGKEALVDAGNGTVLLTNAEAGTD